jgi:hypothetical protein
VNHYGQKVEIGFEIVGRALGLVANYAGKQEIAELQF